MVVLVDSSAWIDFLAEREIATWCIENAAEIIHNDRDMAVMEGALGLVAYSRPACS